MNAYSTTKMSSKGQVVIPEDIREELGLKEGTQFIVVGDKDVVIFKTITPPSIDEFDELLTKATTEAKKAKLTRSKVEKAIKKVRKNG